jgi:hypothetical protein
MSDTFRDDTTSLFDDDDFEEIEEESAPAIRQDRKPRGKFLGMTSFQRFIIAVMLMIAVCMLGTMCLLITGRIGLTL